MKNGWPRRWGFPPQDEMERHIADKAARNGYTFLMAVLVVWTFRESLRTFADPRSFNIFPLLLLMAGMLVRDLSQFLYKHNAVKGDEEYDAFRPWFRAMLVIAVLTSVAMAVAAFVALGVVAL